MTLLTETIERFNSVEESGANVANVFVGEMEVVAGFVSVDVFYVEENGQFE